MKIRILYLISLLLIQPAFSNPEIIYAFDSPQQQAQFNNLLHDLRCVVCQNQDLADSNAPIANDLRHQIYQAVKSGQTNAEILTRLTDRYGDFILFNPPVKSSTWLLWSSPLILLIFGLLLFIKKVKHA